MIRSHKSKDRWCKWSEAVNRRTDDVNAKRKTTKDKQWSSKHYTENWWLWNTNPAENRKWITVLRKGKTSCTTSGNRWLILVTNPVRKEPDFDYDKRNICVVLCGRDSPYYINTRAPLADPFQMICVATFPEFLWGFTYIEILQHILNWRNLI